MKKFYESKTLWFNLITLVIAVLALPEFLSLLPEDKMPYIAVVNAIGNAVLRLYTTQELK